MPMHHDIEVVAMDIDIDGMTPIDGPIDFEFLWTARSQVYFISCLVFMNCFYIKIYKNWKLPLIPQELAELEVTFSSTRQDLQENNFFKSYISFKLYNKNCRKNLLFKTKF
jgi:hypothetical protein